MLKTTQWIVVTCLILFPMKIFSQTKTLSYSSKENQSDLIELYSSEGCSSCPPADIWISELRNHPKLWESIVPVVFHVDYWNRLGWLDPFSSQRWTQRQRNYAKKWKSRNVYTPGFVKNGQEWRDQVFTTKPKKVGVLKVIHKKGYEFQVTYTPDTSFYPSINRKLKIFGAILGNHLESRVLTGENKGKSLKHDFVVLQLAQQNVTFKKGTYKGNLKIPVKLTASPQSLSVAFWIEDQGLPIQSTGGNLTDVELATFAGGCFWCMESPFEKKKGVLEVISGYTGGKTPHPTYKEVSSGVTGHTEAVRVIYNPQQINYKDLLEIFWRSMDPTDKKGQFADRGQAYRPGIYYHNQEQKDLAFESKRLLTKDNVYKKPIVLEIQPVGDFYTAESYHQDYYKKNPLRYQFYRKGSGRDRFLSKIWSSHKDYKIFKDPANYVKPEKKELKKILSQMQFYVTQKDGTEPPFQNEFWNHKKKGIYVDVVSGEPLFSSLDKFDSGTGWPSFTRPLVKTNIVKKVDRKLFMKRTEVRSKNGDSHLGHVFSDGPLPTGLRYCINSASLRFVPVEELAQKGYGEFLKGFEN